MFKLSPFSLTAAIAVAAIPLTACSAAKDESQALQALQASIDYAEEAILDVDTQTAFNRLHAGVANAELAFSVVEAAEVLDGVSDSQMLREMSDILKSSDDQTESLGLLASVVSERPTLAFDLQGVAIEAGYDANQVANIVVDGLGETAATAAGN